MTCAQNGNREAESDGVEDRLKARNSRELTADRCRPINIKTPTATEGETEDRGPAYAKATAWQAGAEDSGEMENGLRHSRGDCRLVLMDYSKIITIEPGKRSGKPCIRGMRIAVQDILEYLAGGMTEEEILRDFSELTRDDIKACLAFAADRERKLFVASA